MPGSKRRAKGEGTYEQLPSGKWRCLTKVEGRKVAGKAALTRPEAASNLRQKLKDEQNGVSRENGSSFTTFARSWLKRKTRHFSPTTIDVYGYWINSLERDPLGSMAPDKIQDRHLKAWKERQTLANETLRKRCSWMNGLLAEMGSDARFIVPPKRDHQRRPLSPKERIVLRECMKKADPTIVLGAMLCWYCGLRRSEACGLKHEDSDGDGFWVRRVVLLSKGKLIVRAKAKSIRSHGWVPIPEPLKDLIGSGKGYVLGTEKEPMNPQSLTWHFSQLFEGTDLAKVPHMGVHTLRRTYGMTLLEVGTDVVTAAKAMRHDPQILLNEYAKTRPDLMQEAVRKAFSGG